MIRILRSGTSFRKGFAILVLVLVGCSCQRRIPPEFEYSPGYMTEEHPAVTVQALSGLVTDATGVPIEHVLVERMTPDFKTRIDARLTDSAGRFRFRRMSTGMYHLRFRYRAFDDYLVSVQVSSKADHDSLNVELVVSK